MLAKMDEKLDIPIIELNSDELLKVLVSNPEIICDFAKKTKKKKIIKVHTKYIIMNFQISTSKIK
jgi:hypothetical protein